MTINKQRAIEIAKNAQAHFASGGVFDEIESLLDYIKQTELFTEEDRRKAIYDASIIMNKECNREISNLRAELKAEKEKASNNTDADKLSREIKKIKGKLASILVNH